MIEISTLKEDDIGRRVCYQHEHGLRQSGKLISWNKTFIFVQFQGPAGEACRPENVSFEYGTPISELSGRSGTQGYEEFKRIASSWGYD